MANSRVKFTFAYLHYTFKSVDGIFRSIIGKNRENKRQKTAHLLVSSSPDTIRIPVKTKPSDTREPDST
jgi:hypothetical protein